MFRVRLPSVATFSRTTQQRVVFYRPPTLVLLYRCYSPALEIGFKDTTPSSSKPTLPGNGKNGNRNSDEGYLSFTKSSLYKLTLPLTPSADGPKSPIPKLSSDSVESNGTESNNRTNGNETWEEQVEKGNEPFVGQENSNGVQSEGPLSVIFLLHSGQPLSYIANLIRAEGPVAESQEQASGDTNTDKSESELKPNPLGDPPITFHTSLRSERRWSPATAIGDFLREAARAGSFVISIGSRNVRVNVPSFEERTRFLRAALREKTKRTGVFAQVKDECDWIALRATKRYAFAGAGIMTSWWVAVGVLTFKTDLGWDFMEPVTYLTGFGMAIGGYIWFLWHNREVSYRTVLTETTSRREQKLYEERGFDLEAYHELVAEVKGLRSAIKRIAWDYELDWDQGDTVAGQSANRALEVVRREEERDRRKKERKEEEEKEEDDVYVKVDDDGDGRPDRRS